MDPSISLKVFLMKNSKALKKNLRENLLRVRHVKPQTNREDQDLHQVVAAFQYAYQTLKSQFEQDLSIQLQALYTVISHFK